MLGLHWQGSGTVDYRTRSLAGRWSAWRTADADTGPDPRSGERSSPAGTTATSTGPAPRADVQFRHAGQRHAAARLLPLVEARSACRRARTQRRRAAHDRARARSWEADEKITRAGRATRRRCKLAVVHHTAGTNRYTPAQAAAIVRGIEVYHVKGNGWNDIGYNFLVDRFGTVYEGRGGGMTRNVIGAHALGFNTGTVGVALIGNFHARDAERAASRRRSCGCSPGASTSRTSIRSRQAVDTSAGNAKFKRREGRDAARDLGPPRHRPDRVPGRPRLRAAPGDRASASRRPGCRSSTRSPRAARSAARPLPGPALVGAAVDGDRDHRRPARSSRAARGRSTLVDWTWSSAQAGEGAVPLAIDAGAKVFPAQGTLGGTLAVTPAPQPRRRRTPAPTPRPRADHARDADAASPCPSSRRPSVVTGLTVAPGVDHARLADGTGLAATVELQRSSTAAQVTVTVDGEPDRRSPPLDAALGAPPGRADRLIQWDVGILAERPLQARRDRDARRARSRRSSRPPTSPSTARSAPSSPTPASFSPNGDGVNDTMTFGVHARRSRRRSQVAIQRAGVDRRDGVRRPSSAPGTQSIGWDGTSFGARLPDGDYVAVVTATTSLGTVSLLQPVVDRRDAAGADAARRRDAALRPQRGGDRHGRRERPVGRRSASRAGSFTIPWTGGPVTSFTAQPRDAAGNAGAPSAGREPRRPGVVAALEPVEDLDQQLEPVALDRRPRPATAPSRR